jgi:hypothetical protein
VYLLVEPSLQLAKAALAEVVVEVAEVWIGAVNSGFDRLADDEDGGGGAVIGAEAGVLREAAMAGIYGKARDPAIAQLIARIRKVE